MTYVQKPKCNIKMFTTQYTAHYYHHQWIGTRKFLLNAAGYTVCVKHATSACYIITRDVIFLRNLHFLASAIITRLVNQPTTYNTE